MVLGGVVPTLRDFVAKSLASRDSKIAALEWQLAKAREATDSLERRASRHAEHLAKLESRMQAMERKA